MQTTSDDLRTSCQQNAGRDFNPRPCVRGDNTEKKSKNFSHIIRLMTIRPRRCQSRWCDIRIFNPHPHKGATSGAYLVSSRTAAVNPTAKACFCQSSHSCNRASRASLLTAVVRESNCLCRASGSNKSGSRLHSPSYRASNSGFSFSPLDFSRLVCYHRFSSVSALCWVVSVAFGGRALTALFFFAQNKCNPLSNRCCFCKFVVFTVLQKCPVRVCINPDFQTDGLRIVYFWSASAWTHKITSLFVHH